MRCFRFTTRDGDLLSFVKHKKKHWVKRIFSKGPHNQCQFDETGEPVKTPRPGKCDEGGYVSSGQFSNTNFWLQLVPSMIIVLNWLITHCNFLIWLQTTLISFPFPQHEKKISSLRTKYAMIMTSYLLLMTFISNVVKASLTTGSRRSHSD